MNTINHKSSGSVFKSLLFIHGLITLAAAIVLIGSPATIPAIIGINITREQFILSYFLGAAQLAIAFISFFARNIDDKRSIRLIAAGFIVFHVATAVLEGYAATRGLNSKIIINMVFRLLFAVLFWYYGIYRNKN